MSASRLARQFCFLIGSALWAVNWPLPASGDELSQPQVTVESWVLEVSLADKSRQVGDKSLGDLFRTSAPPRITSLDELGIAPAQLVAELESKKLARALTTARLKLPSGQPGSLQVNGTAIDATATVRGEKICLNYRVEVTEEDPKLRDTVTGKPGYRQRLADMAFEIESGKAVMLPLLPVPGKPHKTIAFLVQATVANTPAAPASTARQPAASGEQSVAAATAAKKSPARLLVDLKVMELDVAKMKRLGFTWSQLGATGEIENLTGADLSRALLESKIPSDQFHGFLEALRQNQLARVIAEPTLVTLDGRPATFVAGGTHLDIVPVLLENGRVRLECRTEITEPAPVSDHVRLDVATEMELGELRPLGFTRGNLPTGDGKQEEREMIVLAKVRRWETSGQHSVDHERASYIELPARRR